MDYLEFVMGSLFFDSRFLTRHWYCNWQIVNTLLLHRLLISEHRKYSITNHIKGTKINALFFMCTKIYMALRISEFKNIFENHCEYIFALGDNLRVLRRFLIKSRPWASTSGRLTDGATHALLLFEGVTRNFLTIWKGTGSGWLVFGDFMLALLKSR